MNTTPTSWLLFSYRTLFCVAWYGQLLERTDSVDDRQDQATRGPVEQLGRRAGDGTVTYGF